MEFSAWNFLAGNGAPDAQSLGWITRGQEANVTPSPVSAFPKPEKFLISITNDVPDTVLTNPYTPEALNSEMNAHKSWGVGRVHWITYENSPAFFAWPKWKEQYDKTFASCPDLTFSALEAAHAQGIEFVADFKLFDLGLSAFSSSSSALPVSVETRDGFHVGAVPEMIGHEEAFMKTNPSWRKEVHFPIKCLRLFSKNPIPEISKADFTLLASQDNRIYTPLAPEGFCITVKKHDCQNIRWTPSGSEREEGTFTQWMLEMSGLTVEVPFLKIVWKRKEIEFENPPFLLAEAEDVHGALPPMELTQRPSPDAGKGAFFTADWMGWIPHGEWEVSSRKWNSGVLGIAFHHRSELPVVLEPLHPVSQEIWLSRIESLVNRGIDGISLRLLCHHANATSWIKLAYGPTVISAFEERHGRAPAWNEDDLYEIRKIRGDAITAVLRKTREICNMWNCIVIFQVETGSEMPPEIGNLMQIHFDYQGWLAEGLIDELHVRAITSQSRWLREFLLPLAKKYGVAVHLVSRNLPNGLEAQAVSVFEKVIQDEIAAGCDGFNFYESVGLYEINSENQLVPRGSSKEAVVKACNTSRLLCEGTAR